MIPVKLSLSGFLSYRQPVSLDFSGFDLACISGHNGAGKSSLLDAITWVLFGQARKNDESIINSACQKAEVTLDFEYENNLYRINRSIQREKGSTVDFFIHNPHSENSSQEWKTLSERTIRDTNAMIVQTLNMDYETFINASFFLQGKADKFATLRPTERKRILGSILGLDKWETYKEQAAAQRKEKEQDVKAVDARLDEILQELSEESARKQRLHELEAQLDTVSASRMQQAKSLQDLKRLETALSEQAKLVKTMHSQWESAEKNRSRTANLLQDRLEDLSTYETQLAHAAEIEQAYKHWQTLRTELSQIELTASKFRHYESQRSQPYNRIQMERARMEQEIKNLEANMKTLEENEAGMEPLLVRAESLGAEVKKLNTQIQERQKIDEIIKNLMQKQADANAENLRLKTEMEALKERITELEKTEGSSCPLCGQPLTEVDRLKLLDDLNQEGTEMGNRYRENKDHLAQCNTQMADYQKKFNNLRQADDALRNTTRQLDQDKDFIRQVEKMRVEWNKINAPRLSHLQSTLAQESFLPEEHKLLLEINEELNALVYDPEAHERLRSQELYARENEKAYQDLSSARAALVPLKREIEALQLQLKQQSAEVEQLQKTHDQAATQLAAQQAQLPDLLAAERALMDAQEAENCLRMDLGAAHNKVLILDILRQRKQTLSEERENLAYQIEELKLLEKSFGKDGVPAMLIEQAIPDIENQANITLGRLSNNTMSVRLATQRDYKDTKRDDKKETLDIRISDGSSERDYEMYSGGEAFRVNFAIRMALAHVLAQRAGARVRTLVIDEGFGNQDAQGRQLLIEAINIVKEEFAKILIITHLEELKEYFPTRIEVEKTTRGSTLMVI